MMILYVLIALVMVVGDASAAEPVKGVFESCPACRLDSMPELKRFFHEAVLKGEYGDKLSVKFIPGATPTLILYAADGSEVSREEVSDKLKYDELHKWVQGKGFKKVAAAAAVSSVKAKSPQPDTSTPAPHPDAAPANTAAARGRGQQQQRLRQRPRAQDGLVGPVERRRRLNPDARAQRQRGAATAAGGQGGMRRRRRRRAAAGAAAGGGGAAAGGGGPGRQTRVRRRVRRATDSGAV